MEHKIFLDNASTTKIDEQVNQLIFKTNLENFFNPSALYHESVLIKQSIDDATIKLAQMLKINPKNIIFTSGATEANNLAIMGSLTSKKGAEYIFSSGEHPSVFNVAKALEQKGYIVHYVNLKTDGTIDLEHLQSLLNEHTHFVSIMYVSNETGAINDIPQISRIIKKYNNNIIFHVDGVQAFGKIPVDLSNVDAFTISAHKFYGPKGVGLLYYKNINVLKPQILGGGQQNNNRSGTENVSGILGLCLASELALQNLNENYQKVSGFRDIFLQKIQKDLCDFDYLINQSENNSPYILSISFKGLKAEVLMHMLDEKGVIIGTGSACSSKKQENRVLNNMHKKAEYIKGSVRISFSAQNTFDEIVSASKIFTNTVKQLYKNISR